MKKNAKKVVSMVLAGALSVSMSMTSLAFYQEPKSKKGLLISSQSMFQDVLDLGVDQVICNQGSYQSTSAYRYLAEKCKENGITFSMIVLNNFGAWDSNLLPVSSRVDGVGNYAFNSMTPEGEQAVRDYAQNMAHMYGDYVSNWIIGNEVNDAIVWDYNGITDIDAHAESYAKTFRIFYEEIKKVNPEARVFIPFDMRWKATDRADRYTVSEYLPKLNALLKDTEYEIAWHPYPVHFFTKPEFMDDDGITDDPNTTPNINMKNLHVLTDYLQNADMRMPDGRVRRVLLTEQGFTSACEDGEARQAAAITEAYKIAKENPYVDGFYLNRQVDAKSQEEAGGAFGLWTRNPNASADEVPLAKKLAWQAYQSLDK